MATPLPQPPGNLHPLSRELLERLAGHAEAAQIVIGGGVALSHYLEYRPTVDLDAWWHREPRADVMAFLEAAMQALASRHGFEYHRRSWGETESLELLQGTQKQFSFQISRRTLALDEPLPSQWEPVSIETLRDNVASKMTALVQRGAPRDFLDIYQLCTCDVMSMADCWQAFTEKGFGIGIDEAKRKIIARLAMIEASRPLETIQPVEARKQAAHVREWYYRVFTLPTP
ncbi:MAG: nucleotidyl transferase AbiEii/AbiGii toxin family protein [Pirellulales bacterium]